MKKKAIIDLSRLDNMITQKDQQIKSVHKTVEKDHLRLTKHGLVLARSLCREVEEVTEVVKGAVPYQCCPVCNGIGKVIADGFTKSVYQVCKVCNGDKIIPMHIIDLTILTPSNQEDKQ